MKHLFATGVVVLVLAGIPTTALANVALLKEVVVDKAVADAARTRPFTLVVGNRKFTAPSAQVKLWFKTRAAGERTLLQLRPGALYDYLNVYISPHVNDVGTSSRFAYLGNDLHLLSGGRKGKIVDGIKTSLAIRAALVAGQSSATVAMKEYRPGVFSAEDFKKLSFPDHLGQGESNFAGSPRARRHNIGVATARYNGIVLQPGEEFSFNAYLGTVDASAGFLPELIIKENVTTPEYGGGICQVSTTAFRAAMGSGMDVTARRNHSYPVTYYGVPGYDATIYQPAPDFRFKNDYAAPVLIKTSIVGTTLIFDVWGKTDGRQVTVNGPFVTGKKPDGQITAAVAQIVKKNGTSIREENFVSKYQSPDKFPIVRKENGER